MSLKFKFSKLRLQLKFNNKYYYIPKKIIISNNSFKEKFLLLTNVNDTQNILNGAFSIIMIYQSKNSGKKIAVKIYNNNTFSKEGYDKIVMNELNFYNSIDYKNESESKYICKYYGKCFDEYSIFKYTYLFLEYLENDFFDSLFIYKKEMFNDYKSFLNIIFQIYNAIEYIHTKGYIYNDLKMENLMLDKNGTIKIIDFNCIIKIDSEITEKLVGTVNYISPEALFFEETNDDIYKLTKNTDYWNIGILIYEFLNLCSFPYICPKNIQKTKENIKKNVFNDTRIAMDTFFEHTKKNNYLNLNDKQIDKISILFANCLKTEPKNRIFMKNLFEVEL